VRFCEAIERTDLRDDPRYKTNTERVAHRHELKRELEAHFQRFTVEELTARLQAADVPCGRVRSMREAIEHPQVSARDLLITQDHAALGRVQTLAPVVKLSRTPADARLPPPALGEHTEEVLAALAVRGASPLSHRERRGAPVARRDD
jgi:crotonobetainyl-CoA:carnitine CoA-transferase CaiB-like acyl-CoA transferase